MYYGLGSSKRQRLERGAVLPLLVIFLIPIVAIIGLAVDTGILLSSRNTLSITTQQAALAALSEYIGQIVRDPEELGFDPGDTVSVNERAVNAAVERAAYVAKMNVTHSTDPSKKVLFANRMTDPTDPVDGYKGSSTAPAFTKGQHNATIDAQSEGLLQVGNYYFDDPKTCDLSQQPSTTVKFRCCPVGKTTCFVPSNTNSPNNSAIKFTTQTPSQNRLKTFFLRLIGINTSQFQVTSIATLVPRNDVFLVDLSKSMYLDSHLSRGFIGAIPAPIPASGAGSGTGLPDNFPPPAPLSPAPNSRSEFVYVASHDAADALLYFAGNIGKRVGGGAGDLNCPNVLPDNPLVSGTDGVYNCPLAPREPWWGTTDRAYTPDDDSQTTGMQQSWDQLLDTIPTPPASVADYIRSRDEYRYFEVPKFQNPGVIGEQPRDHKFLIHWGRRTVDNPRPEPLFSVLEAMHEGMKILRDRRLGSDKLSIYGFDTDGTSPSGNALKVSITPRYIENVSPSTNDMDKFFEATDLSQNVYYPGSLVPARPNFIDIGFFPVPGYNSDVQGALLTALNRIGSSATFRFGKNSIFLFTDGLANCPRVPQKSGGIWEFPIKYPTLARPTHPPCNAMGDYTLESIRNIIDTTFMDEFKSRNISVSIALIGQGIQPHFVARKAKGEFGCATQAQAAKQSTPDFYVKSGPDGFIFADYDTATVREMNIQHYSGKFRAPNELYKIVKYTEGLWIPIMPTLGGPGDPLSLSPDPVNFNEKLQDACHNEPPGGELDYVHGLKIYQTDFPTLTVPEVQVVDPEGRVLYDPYGRTAAQQMKDAMSAQLTSPFMLADEDPG